MIEIANNHSSLNNRINNEIFVRTLFVRSMDQIISSKTHMYQRNRRAYEKKKERKRGITVYRPNPKQFTNYLFSKYAINM